MPDHLSPSDAAVINRSTIDTVVFDLGGVLVDWNPRHLYRKLFGADEAGMEAFLAEVCHTAWNEQQDRGRPWSVAVAEAVERHPGHEALIRAYHERWDEMLAGAIEGTVAILEELSAQRVRLLALTNWSAETFRFALERFSFLSLFEGIVVSGREGVMKPERAIFDLLISRYRLTPASTVFIDDSPGNVLAASQLGLRAIRFSTPDTLREDLLALALPLGPLPVTSPARDG